MVEKENDQINSTDNAALFQTLAETTAAAIFIVQENIIRYANPTARMVTGYGPELRDMEFWQLAAPGYQEVIKQYGMGNPWAEDIPIRYEIKLKTKEGGERWIDVTAARIDLAGNAAMLLTAFDITDRDQAERELRHSKEELEARVIERTLSLQEAHQRLQAVLKALPVAVWIADAEGHIIEKNAMADKVWGVGSSVGTSGPGKPGFLAWWADSGEPVRAEEWGLYRAIVRGEISTSEVIDIRRFDSQPATLLSSSAPIYDPEGKRIGAVMVQQDITRQRQLEKQETRRADEMNAIVEAMVEAVVVYGADGIPQWANPAAQAMYGFNPIGLERQEVIRRSDLRDGQGIPITLENMPATRALRGETVTRERVRMRGQDGEDRILSASASPLMSEGRANGAVVVLNDISDRVHQEELVNQTVARAQKLSNLSRIFAGAGLDPSAVLDTIVHHLSDQSGDACLLYLVGDEGHTLQLAAYHHPDPEALESFARIPRGYRSHLDEGLIGSVFKSGEPLLVRDVLSEEKNQILSKEYQKWAAKFPVHSALFLPLRTQGRKLGVINLLRHKPGESFTTDDQLFYQELVDRAALAVDNSHLYAQEISRAREMEALHGATTAMLTTLDLDTLLSQILDAAQHAIPAAEQGSLHLIERQTGHLEVRAAQIFHDLRIQKVSLSRIEGQVARAVVERKPLLIHDNLANTELPLHASAEVETASSRLRSAIIAPLLLGDQVLGVLSLIHSLPGKFTVSDLRLLVSFAATATAAIQNATLYAEVQRLATTDTLTGLLNRRRFFELGTLEVDRYQRFGHPLSAIMLDVDNLKQTNDTFGHATGDRLLQSIADRCRANIRRVDLVGRYGGDEFVILLPETTPERALEVAERIRSSIENGPVWTEQGQVLTSASLGVAAAGINTVSLTELLGRADEALYLAKQSGRNRIGTV